MQADYIIIGAGSARSCWANRLTEDPGTTALLIEAGGLDWNPLIHVPADFVTVRLQCLARWLVDRGYTVLSVNFRGSTDFGKTFINVGDGE